jgi:hypothetical protein
VPVDLEGFGEETYDTLRERIYPVYSKASMRVHDEFPANDDVTKEEYDAVVEVLNEALVTERMRNWDSKRPELSDDPDVAELQKQADVPRPMAEQTVKERRRRAIAEMPSQSDKVQ